MTPPTFIDDDDDVSTTNPEEISNLFNNYFADVAENILKERKFEGRKKKHKDFLPDSFTNSINFLPTDEDEIISIISNFKTGKASVK